MIKLRAFKISDTYSTAKLVFDTFKFFNSKDGEKEAVKRYLDKYNFQKNLDKIKKQFSESEIFFVATENNKIVGMIRGRKGRFINLFVNAKCHKKSIGRKLVERYEKECVEKGSHEIKISSSVYAISFYEKLGYKKTTGIRNFKGLKIQPMKKVLN